MTLQELAEVYGVETVKKTNEEQLESKKKAFIKRNGCTCLECKSPMTLVKGTNVFTCTNEKCKGKPVKNKDGSIEYKPVFRTLSEVGSNIANNLF